MADQVELGAAASWSFARISCTRRSLRAFSPSGGTAGALRVPMRMSVAMRGAPLACTAAWQSWMAWVTADHGPSVVGWRWKVSGGEGAEKRQKGTADLGWCRSRYGMRGEVERANGRGRKPTHCICGEHRMDRA